jgi:hypothetical protein
MAVRLDGRFVERQAEVTHPAALGFGQVDPDHHTIWRQQSAQPLRRAFRLRSPSVMPLPSLTGRPPRCVWGTKPVPPHQEDVPFAAASRTTCVSGALSY